MIKLRLKERGFGRVTIIVCSESYYCDCLQQSKEEKTRNHKRSQTPIYHN